MKEFLKNFKNLNEINKIIIYLFLIFFFNNYSYSAKFEIKDINNYQSKDNLDCSKDDGAVSKTNIQYYHTNFWNFKALKKYKEGKSLGTCIYKDGSGWYWTAARLVNDPKGSPVSWVQPTYQIGSSPWQRSLDVTYSKDNKNFPLKVGNINSLNFNYNYSSIGKGFYNHNLTLWFKKNNLVSKAEYEVMLKFNGPQVVKHLRNPYCNKMGSGSKFLDDLVLKNITYKVCFKSLERNLLESKTKGGTRDFGTVVMYPKNINQKNTEFNIQLDIAKVINYLILNNIITNEYILPGLEINSEIWYGEEELKIKNLSYDLKLK